VKIAVKVVPGASRNQISGWLGERLKVRVQAPPESGKANKAIIKLIASALSISPREIKIVSGGTSPLKTIEIKSISEVDFMKKFPA
jgi:uncharacterized protein (TIGR00251 family)